MKWRRMRWVGHVVHMGEMRNAHNTFVRKPEVKIPLRRPRHTWEDNMRMDLRETEWDVWTECIWFRRGTSGGLL
jgi:hypothetical protein